VHSGHNSLGLTIGGWNSLADCQELHGITSLASGLDLMLQRKNLRRREGLAGLLLEVAPETLRETMLTAHGVHEDVEVDLALAWDPNAKTERIRTFVNYSSIDDGGTAPQGLLDAIRAVTEERAGTEAKGVVALVHVMMLHPRFDGPTRNHLVSPEARVAVREVLGRALAAAPWWWDRIHEALSP
jgi:DNA gyrase/topoisomerase IV subunit B